jgi:peptide/nickel transport system substrate-binding protein/oligopeptide transport system substrate-binding protein
MEANDTVKEYIDKLEDLSKETLLLWNQLSTKQMESSEGLSEIREKLKNLYASMYVIYEGSDSFRVTVRKSEELLSFGLSLVGEVMKKIKFFNDSTIILSKRLEELISKREEINAIVSDLQELNETSGNTARNAEIKAYQAGASGKGFEVVAEELGRLTGNSLEIVQDMVDKLESLKERSKLATEKFGAISESLTNFVGNADELKASSDEVRDKISLVMDTSDRLLNLFEAIDIKRRDIEETAGFLLSLSKETLLKLEEIDLFLSQKEAVRAILKNHIDIFRNLLEKQSDSLPINISHIDLALENISYLDRYSQLSVVALSSTPPYGNINLSELESMRKMLGMIGREIEGVKEIIKETQYQAKICLNNIDNVQSFIEKESKVIGEVANIQLNLSRVSSGLGRLVENAGDFTEQLRVISLYAKIESSRIPEDVTGLPAIVEEMQELSNDYSRLGDKLWKFFNPVKDQIDDLKSTTLTLENTIGRLKDIVKESKIAFEENKDQIETLTEVSSSIRPFIDKQEDVVVDISASFNFVVDALKEYAEMVEALEKSLGKEKNLTDSLAQDQHWKNLSSLGIIPEAKTHSLRVGLSRDPLTLNPYGERDPVGNGIIYLLHRGLFDYGFSGRVYPFLVERWELSEDVRRWDFVLKENIKTHKGNNIEAEDVKFMLESLRKDTKLGALIQIDDIEITGKYSFSVKLKENLPSFLSNLAAVYSSVSSKTSSGETIDGIGPFKLKKWKKGERIILKSNPDYLMGQPYLSELFFDIIDNATEAFKRGKLDIAKVDSDKIYDVRRDDVLSTSLFSYKCSNVNYLGFNFKMKESPFADKRVRQALNYAVNKKDMIEEPSLGFEGVSRGLFPDEIQNHDSGIVGYDFDLNRSKRLLEEAGFEGGLPDAYTLLVCNSALEIKRAEFLKEAFSRIGIKVKIQTNPWEKFIEKIKQGKAEMFLTSWLPDNVEPDDFLFHLFHSSSAGKDNLTFYSNKNIDSKIIDSLREINPMRSKRLRKQLEKLIVEDAPWVFLANDKNYLLINEKVFGFKPSVLDYVHYEWMGIE